MQRAQQRQRYKHSQNNDRFYPPTGRTVNRRLMRSHALATTLQRTL